MLRKPQLSVLHNNYPWAICSFTTSRAFLSSRSATNFACLSRSTYASYCTSSLRGLLNHRTKVASCLAYAVAERRRSAPVALTHDPSLVSSDRHPVVSVRLAPVQLRSHAPVPQCHVCLPNQREPGQRQFAPRGPQHAKPLRVP